MVRVLIREIVKQALDTGYLTIEAEEQLRQRLQGKYGSEDYEAFMSLQQAAMKGTVKQQSREFAFAMSGQETNFY